MHPEMGRLIATYEGDLLLINRSLLLSAFYDKILYNNCSRLIVEGIGTYEGSLWLVNLLLLFNVLL